MTPGGSIDARVVMEPSIAPARDAMEPSIAPGGPWTLLMAKEMATPVTMTLPSPVMLGRALAASTLSSLGMMWQVSAMATLPATSTLSSR